MMLSAVAFLSLRSPVLLAVVPALVSRAASGNPSYWGNDFHYNLVPSVILAFAVLDAVRRMRHWHLWAWVLLALSLLGIACGKATDEALHSTDPARLDDARRAMAIVPEGAPVAADFYLTPHLTAAHPVTQKLLPPNFTDDLGEPIRPEWVVVDLGSRSYGGASGWAPQAIAHFSQQGFVVHEHVGDFVVLRHMSRP